MTSQQPRDLITLRDHARSMAELVEPSPMTLVPPPTPEERALWAQIADEIDDYLTPANDGQEALL